MFYPLLYAMKDKYKKNKFDINDRNEFLKIFKESVVNSIFALSYLGLKSLSEHFCITKNVSYCECTYP